MTTLKKNDNVPVFSGKDQDGNIISNETLAGKKYVVYFYPKDMTPGCTDQACNLRDNYTQLGEQGIHIIVWGPKKFMGKEYDGIHRTTFLISEAGTLVEIISKPKTKDHAAEILAGFNQ